MLKAVKKILVRRLIEIVTECQIIWKNSTLYILILGFLGSASPFFYFMVPADMEGAFGYTYMASLLWSLTVPIMAISYGLLIHTISLRTPVNYRPPLKILSSTILCVGVFCLIFTFLPIRKGSSALIHLGGIGVCSILLVIMAFKLNKVMVAMDDKLRLVIRKSFNFIITVAVDKGFIDPEKKKEYILETDTLLKDVSKMM